MITRIRVKKFKRFEDVDIELGKTVVLIGPNNAGKTTLLQALALWNVGLKRWNEKRKGKGSPEKRPGVTINRNDLISIPIPDANLLWRDLHVRIHEKVNGKKGTKNIRIDIIVDGIADGKNWSCGFEFDYANPESFFCRPLRMSEDKEPQRMPVPDQIGDLQMAFLPPMSGLAGSEPKWEPGRINVLLGEGQTAQVLRNLCYTIFEQSPDGEWRRLKGHIQDLFGVELLNPEYVKERGEIRMAYKERTGTQLDLSSSGRGLQQTLLLLAYLYSNPKTVLLLDEPDAHLEVLRQRQIYQLMTDVAQKQGSQLLAASHSEIVLNEAADRDVVIAFVGKPHRIDDRGSQIMKALTGIGFDQYYQAEQMGWVLYLEGPSDLAALREFARKLGHEAVDYLERPFVHYIGTNLPNKAREHFFGLREAKKNLVGIALFDRLDKDLHQGTVLQEMMWKRREIENYMCLEEVLLAYARQDQPQDDLFGQAEGSRREEAMREAIKEVSAALKTLKKQDPWSAEIKASDDFLDPLFETFFKKIELENLLRKSDYHILARLVPIEKIDPEISEKLMAIVDAAKKAEPSG